MISEYSFQAISRSSDGDTDRIQFKSLREMTASEFDEADTAIKDLSAYVQGLDNYWKIALDDLGATMAEVAGEILDDLGGLKSVEWWTPKITYRLINLSLALRMYEEYVLAEANRVGRQERGVLTKALRAEFSRTFDSSTSYRILYELRNTLAHGSDRAIDLSAAVVLDGKDDSRKLTLSASLNREAVMKRAKAIVGRDLRELGTDPDLLTIVENVSADLVHLDRRIKELVFPTALESARLLGTYVSEAREAGFEQFLFVTTAPAQFRFQVSGVVLNHLIVSAEVMAQARVQLEYDQDPEAARWDS